MNNSRALKLQYLLSTQLLKRGTVELILPDDESIDLRNRLLIIGVNGLIGFVLILFSLFIFLNRQSAIWVALGIP